MDSTAPSTRNDLIWLSATEIARQIASGNLSATQVVRAHIERIEAVNGRLNAVVVPLLDEARAQAAEADLAQHRGERLGPLHGVPLTVKECFHVARTSSSIGVERLAAEIIPNDGPLVRSLRQAGAILLGKTNLPQLMLLHETDNPVYGRTNNPWNLQRSPGGSSGGEAAIVAAGGSALGLASDLGGSIRQPAHSCAVHGLKPTAGRLTTAGSRTNLRGLEAIGVQPGPLARSVADLSLAMQVLLTSADGRDRGLVPLPWKDPAEISIAGLRIGMWTDDGYFRPSPAIRRTVEQAAAALRQQGAEVEPFCPPDMPLAMRLYFGLISADGGADFVRLLGSSRPDWRVKRLLRLGRFPSALRPVVCTLLRRAGQRRLAELIESTGPTSVDQFWQLTAARADYTQRFLAAMDADRFDALLFPPHALPALRHGASVVLPCAASYCFLPNLLGIPAGVVAASRVGPDEETDRPVTGDRVERAARAVEIGSAGLPIGVQVAARHWREEVVLAIMAALESHFRSQADYPKRPPI